MHLYVKIIILMLGMFGLFSSAVAVQTSTICVGQPIPLGWVSIDIDRSSFCGSFNGDNIRTIANLATVTSEIEICVGQAIPTGWVSFRQSTQGCRSPSSFNAGLSSRTIRKVSTITDRAFDICVGQGNPPGWVITNNSRHGCNELPTANQGIVTATITNLARVTESVLNICAGQGNPPGWVNERQIRDTLICNGNGSANPGLNVTQIRRLSQPAACSLSSNPTVVASGDSFSFTVASSNIPAGSQGYWFGTKDGKQDLNAAPLGLATTSYVNTPNVAGTYTRYVEIRNATGVAVCTTAPVTITLLPAPTCSLQVSTNVAVRGGSFTFSASGSNLPAGTVGYWYGTKGGVPDTSGDYAGSIPFANTYTNPADGSATGFYTRQLEIRDGSRTVCTTNQVTISLN